MKLNEQGNGGEGVLMGSRDSHDLWHPLQFGFDGLFNDYIISLLHQI